MKHNRILSGTFGIALFLFGCLALMGQEGRFTASFLNANFVNVTEDTMEGPFGLVSLTTTERNALASPANGDLIYNETTGAVNGYAGGAWGAIGGATGGTVYILTPGGATLPNTNFASMNKKTGTNKVTPRLDFNDDNGTDQCVYWERPSLTTDATSVNFDIKWMADAATGTTVRFLITQDGVANDEVWDAAGTTVTANDTLLAVGDAQLVTVAGTFAEWGANETVSIKFCLDEDQGDLADVVSVMWVKVRVE